jgi:hypothetical protein
LPRWTKRVVAENSGRDPLGLSRVSGIIADYLLSGIVANTDRARYYSFYAWALWHIEHHEPPKAYADFVDSLRRREAAAALATLDAGGRPVGIIATRKEYTRGKARGELNADFRILPSNQLGNFGQYYSGSLYALGLTYRGEDGIDRAAEGAATRLAQLLQSQLARTPYIRNGTFRNAAISVKDLRKTRRYLSIDAITQPFAEAERGELIDLFFARKGEALTERERLRRHTLSHILHVIDAYGRLGSPPPLKEVDRYLVYPVYYYGVLRVGESRIAVYHSLQSFSVCYAFWRQFCLHQYLTQAVEILFWAVLETLAKYRQGLAAEEIVQALVTERFRRRLNELTAADAETPSAVLRAIGINAPPTTSTSSRLWREVGIRHRLSEFQLLGQERDSPEDGAAVACALLAVLYGRWRASDNIGWHFVGRHAGNELWAGNVLTALDGWLARGLTWEAGLRDFIRRFVFEQHQLVLFQKGRLDAAWLHLSDGRYFKDQDYEPDFRTSRHRSAVGILIDLRLVRVDSTERLYVTAEGRTILREGVDAST